MTDTPRILPVGDAAATVELGDSIDPAVNARVRALDRALAASPFRGFAESVPTYRSLLVLYDPLALAFGDVREELGRRLAAAAEPETPGTLRTIPTRYGGEDGPDLPDVARARGLTEAEIVSLHASREYSAFMLGFTPGFAYLGLLPEALETPRRPTPRVRVPAGSVAVAGRQTAIYPVASPGGWSLIGRTSLRLFDPHAHPAALVLPGDRVRFVPVDTLPETPPASPSARPSGASAIEVLEPGVLTTVQDGGRLGYRRLGVGRAGPMDLPAHRVANRLVGNATESAALECTVTGPTLRFLATIHFAVTGADLGAVLHRADLDRWPVPSGVRVLARAGNVLSFEGRRAGCRAYVAFAGAIDVPPVLGSRATDLPGGFGGFEGRALRAGDLLSVGAARRSQTPPPEATAPEAIASTVTVRVVPGPQDDSLTAESVARFLSETYLVGPASDRTGCRLVGPRLTHRGPAEIVSDGMVPGSIQVPPDGQPIVMMADAPTTGGYPKIATVVTADIPRLAQLLPGEGRLRFEAVTVEEAQRALRR